MGRIKGWTKQKFNKSNPLVLHTWRNDVVKISEVSVIRNLSVHTYKYGKFVTKDNIKGRETYTYTEKEALAFAIKYMRSNPNG